MHQEIKKSILEVNQTAKQICLQVNKKYPKKYQTLNILPKNVLLHSSKTDEQLTWQLERQRQIKMRKIIEEYDQKLLTKIQSNLEIQTSKRIVQLQKQKQRYKMINNQLKNDQQVLKEELIKYQQFLSISQQNLQEQKVKVKELMQQNKTNSQSQISLTKMTEQLKLQIKSKRDRQLQLQKMIRQYSQNQIIQNNEYKLLQDRNIKLQQKLQQNNKQMQQIIQEKQIIVSQYQNKLRILEGQLQKQINKNNNLQQQYKKIMLNHEQAILIKNKQFQTIRLCNINLQSLLSAQQIQSNNLQQELFIKSQQILQLQSQIICYNELQQKYQKQSKQIQQLQTLGIILQQKQTQLLAAHNQIQQSLTKIAQLKQERCQQYKKYQQQIQIKNMHIASIEQNNVQLKNKIQKQNYYMQQKIKKLQQINILEIKQNQKLRQQINHLKLEIQVNNITMEENKIGIVTKDKQIYKMKEILEGKNEEILELKDQMSKLQRNLQIKQEELTKLKLQFDQNINILTEQHILIEKLQKQSQKLPYLQQKIVQEQQIINTNISLIQQQHKNNHQLQQKIKQITLNQIQLQQHLQQQKIINHNIKQQLNIKQQQIKLNKNIILQLNKKINQKQIQINKYKQYNIIKQKQIQELLTTLKNKQCLQIQINRQKDNKINDLERQKLLCQDRIQEYVYNYQVIRKQYEQLVTQNYNLKVSIKQLKIKIEQLNNKKQQIQKCMPPSLQLLPINSQPQKSKNSSQNHLKNQISSQKLNKFFKYTQFSISKQLQYTYTITNQKQLSYLNTNLSKKLLQYQQLQAQNIKHFNLLNHQIQSLIIISNIYKESYLKMENKILIYHIQNNQHKKQIQEKKQQFQILKNDNNKLTIEVQQLVKQKDKINKRIYDIENKTIQNNNNQSNQIFNQILYIQKIIDMVYNNCSKNYCNSIDIINAQLHFDQVNNKHNKIDIINHQNCKRNYNNDQVLLKKENKIYKVPPSILVEDQVHPQIIDQQDPKSPIDRFTQPQLYSSLKFLKVENQADTNDIRPVTKMKLHSKLSLLLDGETQYSKKCITQKGKQLTPIKDEEIQSKNQNQDEFSLQNNPDTQITWTYQQLKQKYRQLKIQHDKITQYFCHLHNIHHKWKKISTQIDHHSKINFFSKIFQKLTSLNSHSQYGQIKLQQHQIFIQINNVIKDLQNYIHFLDHLIKYQPFQEYYKNPSLHKKLKKSSMDRQDRQILFKKTYSQGGNRQDYMDNLDLFTYQFDDNSPIDEGLQPIKQGKAVRDHLFENSQEHRDLFSEISSVKHQSLRSHQSSFFNSKSQLGQLGQYFKNYPNILQIDQYQSTNNKLLNDSDKEISFNQLKKIYHKTKGEKQYLMKERQVCQRNYKKQIENIENQYKKRMNKMTKQFNDSFGLLCQRTGLYFKKQKDKHFFVNANPIQPNKDVSIQMDGLDTPLFRKASKSKTEMDQNYQKLKQQYNDQQKKYSQKLYQKQQKLQQYKILLQKTKQKILNLQKIKQQNKLKIQQLNILLNQKNYQIRKIIHKYDLDIDQFIKKIISRTFLDQNIRPAMIIQNKKAFRKNNHIGNNDVSASKIYQSQITLDNLMVLLAEEFKMQHLGEFKKINFTEKNMREFIKMGLKSYQKSLQNKYINIVIQKLKYFQEINSQDWYIYFQQISRQLQSQNEKITQFLGLIDNLVDKIKQQAQEYDLSHLSINSIQNLQTKHLIKQGGMQKQDNQNISSTFYNKQDKINKQIDVLKQNYEKKIIEIKQINNELMQQNKKLNQVLQKKQLTSQTIESKSLNQKGQIISQMNVQKYEIMIKQKQNNINSMQKQLVLLKQQILKLKKLHKNEIYHYIDN